MSGVQLGNESSIPRPLRANTRAIAEKPTKMPPASNVQRILESVPATFRGPGGAVAVIKDGELAGQHAWGYANLDARIPVTRTTIFPICSISKQMVCLVLTELLQKDEDGAFENALIKALHELLPPDVVANKDLTVERLVAMQSGLRDYWALSVLWGATPGGRFSIYQDAPKALKRLGGFHFPPGTQMSYSNTNFMAVGLAIERATGQTLGDLLEARLFKAAGMTTAALHPDTERLPPPIVGYEGSEGAGYVAYQNRIEWAGDAGIQASLEDMIAYEKYIDRSWTTDPQSAYSKNAQEPHYLDGTPANYGYGLMHGNLGGIKIVGHSGALAGFRLIRLYAAETRISVVALLNSEMDSEAVAAYIFREVIKPPRKDQQDSDATEMKVDWTGPYLDENTNLAIAVTQDRPDELLVDYAGHDEKLKISSTTQATSNKMKVDFEQGPLTLHRLREGRQFTARPVARSNGGDENDTCYTGSYHSDDIDSKLHCSGVGDMLYGYFDGYLGQGPAHLLRHIGEDIWLLACNRSLDAPAPGNWTVVFHRGDDGKTIRGATVGCWLARNVRYARIEKS